jgi:hypothetical protein
MQQLIDEGEIEDHTKLINKNETENQFEKEGESGENINQ